MNANIRYNIITKSLDEGIQLRDCDDCVVEYNHVFNVAQDGINMCCDSANGIIQFNEVHGIGSENAAIYIYGADSIQISDNLVYDVIFNDGIKMGAKLCNDPAPNGSIERNVVHNTAQDGITVYSSNTEVRDNEIYNSFSENGALYISCQGTTTVTVEGNVIHDNGVIGGSTTYGVRVGKSGAQPIETSTIIINGNCIQGNEKGMINDSADLDDIDATGNWWGASDGPSGVSPTASGDSVSTKVDFDPFLVESPKQCRPKCNPKSCKDSKGGSESSRRRL